MTTPGASADAAATGDAVPGLENMDWSDFLARNAIRSGLILTAFAIAQLNDVGKICNLVGGVFQVVLAFIIPPALALKASEQWGRPGLAAGPEALEPIPVEFQDESAQQRIEKERQRIASYITMGFGGACCVATLSAFFADVLSH